MGLVTFFTPSDAAPDTGFRTAGKPTTWAASCNLLSSVMRKFLGVGKPASFKQLRVACLFLAASTAAGLRPGKPKASAKRAASGTESSTKVAIPSAGPVTPSSPSSLMCCKASLKIASESCVMSTGMNFAARPSSTKLLLQESGCSKITGFTPKAAAISKVNFLPGSPAVTKTTVEPFIICLRSCFADSLVAVKRFFGTFANIWKVAVGSKVRMASSLSSAVSGGNLPGEGSNISASNLLRPRPVWPTRLLGMSVSMVWRRGSFFSPGLGESTSMTMSKSTGPALFSVSVDGRRRGIGEAQSKEAGVASHEPSLGRSSFMASV
mmetsp:Transcript_25915/g.41991  ORF Transcript_25915/g.41991 Transcript_25915/m.41991 type:complete len:323 (+) Transcript_25915:875-1843(+)